MVAGSVAGGSLTRGVSEGVFFGCAKAIAGQKITKANEQRIQSWACRVMAREPPGGSWQDGSIFRDRTEGSKECEMKSYLCHTRLFKLTLERQKIERVN